MLKVSEPRAGKDRDSKNSHRPAGRDVASKPAGFASQPAEHMARAQRGASLRRRAQLLLPQPPADLPADHHQARTEKRQRCRLGNRRANFIVSGDQVMLFASVASVRGV